MKRETWLVNTNEKIIMPADLRERPDDYGGVSMHMVSAVANKVITIPLHSRGVHVSVQVCDPIVAERIISDGRVDIEADGYWCSITSPKVKVLYFGTEEEIPMWRGGIFQ